MFHGLEARRYRKALGGGMRQVGVIAAAGLLALTEMFDRVKVGSTHRVTIVEARALDVDCSGSQDDHQVAKQLGQSLTQLPGLKVDVQAIQTNICTRH